MRLRDVSPILPFWMLFPARAGEKWVKVGVGTIRPREQQAAPF